MTDIPGDSSTTATLAVGSTATDSLETVGDHDWFRITLTAGQPVTVNVTGLTLVDPYLNIRDAGGNIIYSNDDIVDGVNRNSQVSFNPPSTGTYYIDVGSWNDQFTGTYQVSVRPYVQPPLATNDQIAAQLISGYWGGDVHHFNVTQGGTITVNMTTLKASEQTLARAALQEWSDIIGVHFQEVSSGGQIAFDDSADPSGPIAATDATYSGGITTSAHVHISTSWVNNYGTGLNTYSFQTYLHEIGHALGLGHAGNYNDTATFPYDASFLNDAWSTSIMSYFDQRENTYFGGLGFSRAFTITPMPADILAMQQLYGISTTTRTSDTTYGYNSNAGGVYDATLGQAVAFTIFDNGGNDTLDFSGNSQTQLINLNPETYSNVYGLVGNMTIARGTVIENAIGGGGADTIIGNSADNIITGNLGPDNLTGGAGNDTFKDTISGHSGDTITDFSAGDRIVFTDATLGGFSFSLSGNTLTYTGGSMTMNGIGNGHLTATATASGGVQLSETVKHIVADDFNGDGISDILWRDGSSGYLTEWLGTTTGGFIDNSANAGTGAANTSWTVAGIGDFNGDGISDILWRNTANGFVTEWLGTSSGAFTDNSVRAGTGLADYSWQIVGTGDINGDGMSDILWRNASGFVTEWLGSATGAFTDNSSVAGTGIADNSWRLVGTGDFNGDGRADILWRNATTGFITDWLGTSSGGFTDNSARAGTGLANSSWAVAGVGDFNGDGISDILWRNATSGYITDWLGTSSGGFIDNSANAGTGAANTSWTVAGIGDFNHDGISDILWRNATSGYVTEWLGTSTGTFISNEAHAGTGIANNGWHVQDTLFG